MNPPDLGWPLGRIGPCTTMRDMDITEIIVHGATGRMGREVLALIDADRQFRLCGQLPGQWPTPVAGSVVVDFSLPQAMDGLIGECLARQVPLVSGTTGLAAGQLDQMREAAKQIPVLWAPNFSLGIAVLQRALRLCAAALPADWDVHLIDTHHRHKLDAPSGTARALAQTVDQQRASLAGARPVQVVSSRVGEVIGDHQLCFAGPSERLELTHRADRRSLFAAGALHAARWLQSRPAGWYSLDDCIGGLPPDDALGKG